MRPYLVAVILLWLLLAGIALPYAMLQRIPAGVALPVGAAFLLEGALYLVMAFPDVWRRLQAAIPPLPLAGLLTVSGVVSYLIYGFAGSFRWDLFLVLLSLCAVASYWFLLTPRAAWSDVLFLVLVAAVILSKTLKGMYVEPWEKVQTAALGQLVWLRITMLSVLWFRRMEGIRFGFWPRRAEWLIGLRNYGCFLPFALTLGFGLGYIQWREISGPWWEVPALAVATFAGMMWVVALGEEFFFRGLLQQWLSGWLGSARRGLLAAAILFGVAHLPFRAFPNWKFALLAAVAGFFYGRAFQQAGGIRAAMVAHALTNVTFRVFFVS